MPPRVPITSASHGSQKRLALDDMATPPAIAERWASAMVSLNLGWKRALNTMAETALARTARKVLKATACNKAFS